MSEEQALWFRARRTHLAGPGAADVEGAARALLGAQAQQENPALLALSLRTRGRPPASAVRARLLEAPRRTLVRSWGQRDTLHVYAAEDWPLVVASLPAWPRTGRRGAMPTEADLEVARRAFERAGGPLFRRQLFDLVPPRFLEEVAGHPGAGKRPEVLAASRLIWYLARRGEICFAHKKGNEQAYVHRDFWLPDFERTPSGDQEDASVSLARRYLSAFAPAAPADLAHFFGSTVGAARGWLERLDGELVNVESGSRRELLALAEDVDELSAEPPRGLGDWPVRLLPQWDTHTMTHKDKSWVVPREEELKRVWRPAAVNAPTVVARGRFVATWAHRATTKRVTVTVSPLSGWRASHRRQVEREARQLAAHLDVEGHEVIVE